MTLMHIKPTRTDTRVIDPDTGEPISAAGVYAEMSVYWANRVRDGDVTVEEFKAERAVTKVKPMVSSEGSK